MKRFMFCLLILLPFFDLPAQNRSIIFQEGGRFQAALDSARETGKLLFMDCYTSWCGPCKMMAKTVFTIDSIADFFNTRFVNLKMDMEKGEGVALKEKYQIKVYPTLLLIDAEGEAVFRLVGGCSAADLLSQIREGMKPENSLSVLNKKYERGCRDLPFIRQYCQVLGKGYQRDRLQEVLHDYFGSMKVKDICREENWDIYHSYVGDINDPLYHRMVKEIRRFKALRGDSVMEQKLGEAYAGYIFNSIPNTSLTEQQFRQFSEDIPRIGIRDTTAAFYLNSYLEIARLKMLKRYDAILELLEAGPVGYDINRRMTLVMSLGFLEDGTREQRLRGLKLLSREVKAWKQHEGGMLAPNIANVLGGVQQKLMGKDISFH